MQSDLVAVVGCTYKFIVIDTSECPMILLTAVTSAPFSISRVAKVCLAV